MQVHRYLGIAALTSTLILGATAVASSAAGDVTDPSQPSASHDVELGFWGGEVDLFADGSAELASGESLGSWWIEHGEDCAIIHVNMGTYGDGAHLALTYYGDVNERDSGGAQLSLSDGSTFDGVSIATDLALPIFVQGPDECFRICPGTEHPTGNPFVNVCIRKRGRSFTYLAKTQNGGEYMFQPTSTSGPTSGEGFVQVGDKVYWICWKDRA